MEFWHIGMSDVLMEFWHENFQHIRIPIYENSDIGIVMSWNYAALELTEFLHIGISDTSNSETPEFWHMRLSDIL